jgi:hypothetical protein
MHSIHILDGFLILQVGAVASSVPSVNKLPRHKFHFSRGIFGRLLRG